MDKRVLVGEGVAQNHRQAAGSQSLQGCHLLPQPRNTSLPTLHRSQRKKSFSFYITLCRLLSHPLSYLIITRTLDTDGGRKLGKWRYSIHILHSDAEIVHDYSTPALGLELRSQGLQVQKSLVSVFSIFCCSLRTKQSSCLGWWINNKTRRLHILPHWIIEDFGFHKTWRRHTPPCLSHCI